MVVGMVLEKGNFEGAEAQSSSSGGSSLFCRI